MSEEMNQASQHGHLAAPAVLGMVRAVQEKTAEMNTSRWFDQIIGSAITGIIVVLTGWMMGIPALKEQVTALAVQVQEVKVEVKEAREDSKVVLGTVNERTKQRIEADAALDKRMAVMEEQHHRLLDRRKP